MDAIIMLFRHLVSTLKHTHTPHSVHSQHTFTQYDTMNAAVSPCGLHVPIMWGWVSFRSAINENLLIVGAQRENAVAGLLGEDGPVATVVCTEEHISCSLPARK